ncbi:MAG: hypothetical protein IJS12_06070 [Lachnospiraceae bacterium]|nr:hypothetical protein [Lachnospiraceae bacterium]
MTDNSGKITGEDLRSILDEFDAQIEQDMQDICNIVNSPEDIAEPGPDTVSEDDYMEANNVDAETETDNVEAETEADKAEPDVAKAVGNDSGSDDDDDAEYKNWLFEENIRLKEVEHHLEEEKERLEAYEKELEKKARDVESMSEKFIQERAQFRDEMNLLTGQVTRERQRLKQDEQFFDKKMDILKAGFADLDKAKRELEAERMRYDAQSSYYGDDDIPGYGAPIAKSLFIGITNPLMLKKRYKDLVKIYHPDNLAGDHDLFKAITIEYERLQSKIGSEGIG